MGEVPVVGGHPGEIRPVSSYLPLCCIPGQGGLLRPLRTLGRVDAHVNMPSQISQVGFFFGGGKCKKTSRLFRSATLHKSYAYSLLPVQFMLNFLIVVVYVNYTIHLALMLDQLLIIARAVSYLEK